MGAVQSGCGLGARDPHQRNLAGYAYGNRVAAGHMLATWYGF